MYTKERNTYITIDQVKQSNFINSYVEFNVEVSQAREIKTANFKGRDQGNERIFVISEAFLVEIMFMKNDTSQISHSNKKKGMGCHFREYKNSGGKLIFSIERR